MKKFSVLSFLVLIGAPTTTSAVPRCSWLLLPDDFLVSTNALAAGYAPKGRAREGSGSLGFNMLEAQVENARLFRRRSSRPGVRPLSDAAIQAALARFSMRNYRVAPDVEYADVEYRPESYVRFAKVRLSLGGNLDASFGESLMFIFGKDGDWVDYDDNGHGIPPDFSALLSQTPLHDD